MSVDTLFTAIKNGTWHSIDGLSNQLAIPIEKLKELSRFLSDSGVIKYEENNSRIKMQPDWTPLLSIEETPKTPQNIIASFIIPPHASIDIKSTHISNMSNVEIEINLRIDNKIREMTIEV